MRSYSSVGKEQHIVIARILLHILILLILSVPVSGFAAPVISPIAPGFNVTGVTAELVAGQQTAIPLLTSWKPLGVIAIESYDANSGKMLRAELDGGGYPVGVDFPLIENSALYVYSSQLNTLPLGNSTSCAPLNLVAGFNLASHACFPPLYQASQFITSIGAANITSLSRLDLHSGRWQTAAVDSGTIVGNDFPLIPGEGYVIQAAAITSGWNSPQLGLTPATLAVQQGQPGTTLTVTISGAAPAGGTQIDLVSSDPTLVSVPAQVTVLQGNTSVSIPLTLPDTGSSSIQSVTVTASRPGMNSSQASLSVRPKPTINLSPLTTLTGLTFTYLLTVNLSDVAPPGGFPVSLAAAPTGIVSVPASVTIPAGTSSVQVTVTAIAVGNSTIIATAPGRGVSGTQNIVTVKPIQTMNYGPLITAEVGIQVGPPPTAPTSVAVTYSPVASAEVGVAVGPVFTGVSPNHGAIGITALPVTISGYGLNVVTGISLYPATGITVGTPSVAPDGLSATVLIDITANAVVGGRTVLVTTATGSIMPSRAGADIFTVTLQTPEIYSIQPIRAMVGQNVTMSISGKNLNSASSVEFTPSTGILVNNPPTVSPDGTMITTVFAIAANAPLGDRVVTVTTPGGTASTAASPANTFSVTSDLGTAYSPLISTEVGVLVQLPIASTNQNANYGPTVSPEVGVTVGSTITSITPVSAAIGATGVRVRALGIGLSSATALSFYPPDGITVHAETFAIGGDGNPEVIVDIAANAPVTLRTVLVALPSGTALPSSPDSDKFRVTLPKPEIYSVQPNRAMVGQSVSTTIMGKNFASASSLDFTPSTGITVINPPTISPDGTMITTSFTIAVNAPLGDRVVTVTTPGGTSSATASTANTFSVTSDLGTTYTPLVSAEVGILVSPPAGSNQVSMPYGPVSSAEVGIMVTPAAPPTSQNVDYGPVVSSQVGVAVGGVLTGFSPAAMEPGSTVTYTLTGVGLASVTGITVVPSANLTVVAWTPAGDGLSGTVTITADSGAVSGARTLVPMAGSAALPSIPGHDILLIGYKPIVNSISTTFPASSVQATVGTTYTLTLNGMHLQGVTKVEVIPSDGITIGSLPNWFTIGASEYVSVTIIVAADAVASDRLVLLTTPYGSSSAIPDTANTLSIFRPIASISPDSSGYNQVAADETSATNDRYTFTSAGLIELIGLSGRKLDVSLLPSLLRFVMNPATHSVNETSKDRLISTVDLPQASRGPPLVIA
jgi:hypothetical protein